jgi:hypothetical protein
MSEYNVSERCDQHSDQMLPNDVLSHFQIQTVAAPSPTSPSHQQVVNVSINSLIFSQYVVYGNTGKGGSADRIFSWGLNETFRHRAHSHLHLSASNESLDMVEEYTAIARLEESKRRICHVLHQML